MQLKNQGPSMAQIVSPQLMLVYNHLNRQHLRTQINSLFNVSMGGSQTQNELF